MMNHELIFYLDVQPAEGMNLCLRRTGNLLAVMRSKLIAIF